MADEEDPDRSAILRRRRRFIAVALGALATQGACGDDSAPDAGPCLSMDAGGFDAQPCLGADAGPLPRDGGSDGGAPRDAGRDATVMGLDGSIPTPCLSMVPPDAAPEKR